MRADLNCFNDRIWGEFGLCDDSCLEGVSMLADDATREEGAKSYLKNGGKSNAKHRLFADGDSVAESEKKADWLIGGQFEQERSRWRKYLCKMEKRN